MQNERQATLWRLRTAEGHLHAVINLLEAGCNCEKALVQLNAVRGAIDRIATQLLSAQVEHCTQVILSDPVLERRCTELNRLVALYELWLKSDLNSVRIQEEINL